LQGVPPTDLTAISLLNAVRPTQYPIIVHCSAGIGRTGSIVMMEYVIELFLAGKPFEKSDDILSQIREQRGLSIQVCQY
jgi:protein tyrosine phosphatase